MPSGGATSHHEGRFYESLHCFDGSKSSFYERAFPSTWKLMTTSMERYGRFHGRFWKFPWKIISTSTQPNGTYFLHGRKSIYDGGSVFTSMEGKYIYFRFSPIMDVNLLTYTEFFFTSMGVWFPSMKVNSGKMYVLDGSFHAMNYPSMQISMAVVSSTRKYDGGSRLPPNTTSSSSKFISVPQNVSLVIMFVFALRLFLIHLS